MARIARGAITITDIADGSNPIAAVLTNQNHTFPANEMGVVTSGTLDMFSTEAIVYIGSTRADWKAGTAALTDNTFRIKPVVTENPTTADSRFIGTRGTWLASVNTTTGVLKVTAADTSIDSVILAVVIEFKDPQQSSDGRLELTLSLAKVNEGAGGTVISITPDKQSFFANSAGTLDAGQSDAIIGVTSAGSPGDLSVAVSQNGAAFSDVTTTGDTAGGISGYDTDTSGTKLTGTIPATFQRLFISQENLGTNDTLAVRVTGATGGVDVVSFQKVYDGATGAAAINVSIVSSTGGSIFKNNTGTDKVLSVVVTDSSDGSTLTPTNYKWIKDGTTARVTSTSTRTVIPSGGVEADGADFVDITVGPDDITDNGSNLFECEVTVT